MMEENQSNRSKNIGTVIHLGVFSKYLVPFGNFILPLAFWVSNRKDTFIDKHGKACLNFQISIFLYATGLTMAGVLGVFMYIVGMENHGRTQITEDYINFFHPSDFSGFLVFLWTIGLLFIALLLFEFICVVQAAVKASEGKMYRYPIAIPFLKPNHENHEDKNTKKASP